MGGGGVAMQVGVTVSTSELRAAVLVVATLCGMPAVLPLVTTLSVL